MILCCGEALIDMLPRVSAQGEVAYVPYPGGAVFNTAIGLGRLGAKSGLFSGISTDYFGEVLADALKASNVASDLAIRTSRPTTLAFARLVDGQPSFSFYDENSAGRMIRPDDLPDIPPAVGAMFFGGISLVGEPCGSAYEALMTREAASRMMMLDPNIRPGFISDTAAYRARIDRMIARADIVKVSDQDLRWLAGDGAIADLAKGILERGPKLVLVTEGARGATAFARDHQVFVAAEKVDVIDTVGAGDTFNAGILAALHECGALSKERIAALDRDTLGAALSLGVRAAGVTVSRAGANPPWLGEL
ncbi:MAG: carbohydrate kinase family protein [Paracoccaceae bacterium]